MQAQVFGTNSGRFIYSFYFAPVRYNTSPNAISSWGRDSNSPRLFHCPVLTFYNITRHSYIYVTWSIINTFIQKLFLSKIMYDGKSLQRHGLLQFVYNLSPFTYSRADMHGDNSGYFKFLAQSRFV